MLDNNDYNKKIESQYKCFLSGSLALFIISILLLTDSGAWLGLVIFIVALCFYCLAASLRDELEDEKAYHDKRDEHKKEH